MEKLRIIGDKQGNTRMIEIPTESLDFFELESIFLGQVATPDRGIIVVGTEKSVAIKPEKMKEIRELKAPERSITVKSIVDKIRVGALYIQIFAAK